MAAVILGLLNIGLLGIGAATLYAICNVFYNLYLHPLRKFPGPILMKATRSVYYYKLIFGTLSFDILDLHNRYGDIVRIAPNELAFINPQAWKDIMGFRGAGGAEMDKYSCFYRPIPEKPTDIVNAGREEHGLLRRQLAHGFSERSMRDQQPIIMAYIDLFLRRLQENCADGRKPVNMTAWYNYTTFDIIGDLAFGESFGCLDNSHYHPWVRRIFMLARAGTLLQAAVYYAPLDRLLKALIPRKAIESLKEHEEMTQAKILKRMDLGYERPDLIEGLLKKKDEWNLSIEKLEATASILIIGGSETTATLLAGVTYYLLKTPDALEKLTREIRSSFSSEGQINFMSVNSLPYLLACLDEGLRIYPPVPTGLPRVVPRGGCNIAGAYVPENTVVAVHQWALYHDGKAFADPFGYHPERWLGDPRFAKDDRDALQPFSMGPRNCIGRNLAHVEMRTILARLIWRFDMELADDSKNWTEKQKIYMFWDKGPLHVHLHPVAR